MWVNKSNFKLDSQERAHCRVEKGEREGHEDTRGRRFQGKATVNTKIQRFKEQREGPCG